MKYDIAHALRLSFAAPVWEHHCELRLAPQPTSHQRVRDLSVTVEPPAEVRAHADGFGNPVHGLSLIAPHQALTATLRAKVETSLTNPFDFAVVAPDAERAWLDDALRRQPRLWSYLLHRSPLTPALPAVEGGDFAWPARATDKPLLEALQLVLEWMAEAIEYAPAFQSACAPLDETLATRRGGCQALAHLLVSLARAWGAQARYVLGYHDPGYLEDDAEQSLHAWSEVLIPGAGWRGLDPSTQLVTNDTYVVVAVGRDAQDCPPVRSHFKGGEAAAETSAVVAVRCDQ
ncbi:MAG: transglutaminase family protein [Deltaproteobacteria bacterium]|nr:transglutaminase family protein [Deltaproteobacteria bacterium]